MTWMELHLLLSSMVGQKHPSLCNTPAQLVTAIVNDGELELDLHESLTTGRLVFTPKMLENTNED